MHAKRRIIGAIAVLVAFSAVYPCHAGTKARRIDELLKKHHEYHQFNGVALVAEDGRVILEKGYGYANFEWRIENTPRTRFRIGSITKQFTATVVLQLIDEGKLGLYDEINQHIPEYPAAQGSRVNIHHLMTHGSGIPNYTTLPSFITDGVRDPHSAEDLMALFAARDLEFEPGSEFRYSNSNYVVLGAIIERVTGKPYEELLQERIFEPFGLDNTGYDDGRTIIDDKAYGYEMNIMEYMPARFIDMSTTYASGGLYSTARDLFKWDQALYGNDVFEEKSYLDLMMTPYNEDYGYGWSISTHPIGDTGKRTKVVQHGGGLFGFSVAMWRLVDDRNTIILLDNTATSPANIRGMAEEIFNVLYELPVEDPPEPIGRVVMEMIDDRGIDHARRRYRELKKDKPDRYDFSERELNILGYHYLRGGDSKTAIEVFKMNVEAYPDAFNPYDSLGEGYMIDGQRELAIENYRKSLELNPRNDNARRMLARMDVDSMGREEVEVPIEVLDRYVGTYEIQPGFLIEIRRDGGNLTAKATGQPVARLYASSETTFFFRVIDAEISFQIRPDGKAEQLTLQQDGMRITAQKID